MAERLARMREAGASLGLLFRLAYRAAPRLTVASLAFVPLSAAFAVLPALTLKALVDAVAAGHGGAALGWAVAAGLAAGAGIGLQVARSRITATRTERLNFELDRQVAGIITGIPTLDHFERRDFLDRVDAVREYQSYLGNSITAVVQLAVTVVSLIVTVIVIAGVSPWLMLVPLAGLVQVAVDAWMQSRAERGMLASRQDARAARLLFQAAQAPATGKEIRVFGLADGIRSRHRTLRARSLAQLENSFQLAGAVYAGTGTLQAAVIGSATLLVAVRAASGAGTAGDVVLTLALVTSALGQASAIIDSLRWTLRSLVAMGHVRWLVQHARAELAEFGSAQPPDRIHEGIAFRGVEFHYQGSERAALRGVDLVLRAGEVVALVGANGAGKTTLVKLLAGMYRPSVGTVEVDGTPIQDFDVLAWRLRLSAGFQDFVRPQVSAGDAVGIGDLRLLGDLPVVRQALERAGSSGLEADLPEGLATQLGTEWERGRELSGGQWQKLALGRAFMRPRPLVLILDEPTASLDAQTEHDLFTRYVADSRAARAAGAITVLVTHRLSTVRMADLVVVMEQGRVAETGTHEELMSRGGTYAGLYTTQARGYR